jgi:hypothetical protein
MMMPSSVHSTLTSLCSSEKVGLVQVPLRSRTSTTGATCRFAEPASEAERAPEARSIVGEPPHHREQVKLKGRAKNAAGAQLRVAQTLFLSFVSAMGPSAFIVGNRRGWASSCRAPMFTVHRFRGRCGR